MNMNMNRNRNRNMNRNMNMKMDMDLVHITCGRYSQPIGIRRPAAYQSKRQQ